MRKLVSIAQHEASCRITSAVIDPLGFVLDLPDGYVPLTLMAELPLMRIRAEHVSAFDEHVAWISDPLLKLREAARSAADMDGGLDLAMQRVIERLEDRGWALASTGEEITRICET
jgi:hypothetical protein